ncbi:MAG: hypothetical protein K8S97_13050 [Anaerolineae bacterium]|nr:hypothetical protein [Anaerolineae bacterium]
MPRYIFSGGKVTVEDGMFSPLKRDDKQSSTGILLHAKALLKTSEQQESTDKEPPDVRS